MKKLILILAALTLAVPSVCFSIQEFKRTEKIEVDEHGGYSETQRDHHSRRKRQVKKKSSGGYYGGTYHNTSDDYKGPGEWQFVGSGEGSSSKKYKKSRTK